MYEGPLKENFPDRTSPVKRFIERLEDLDGKITDDPAFSVRLFAAAGKEHSKKYGTKLEHFAKIAEKNHRHAANNKNAMFRKIFTLDETMKAKMIHWPETQLGCCANADGAAAAVLCSEDFVKRHGLENQAVEINHMSL